jgi:hypothetical protein
LPSPFFEHSAQTLPSARQYSAKKSRRHGARVTETASLPSVFGDTRQKRYFFAECLPTSTRQRIHQWVPLSASLSSALCCTQQSVSLCRVPGPRHSAKKLVPRYWYFAECYDPDTRQSTSLPSVTLGKVSNTHLFYLFFLFYPNKHKIHHRYHIYTSQISSQT